MAIYLPGLMTEQRDQLLLNLGVARGLMDRSTAERIQRMALEQNRRAADLLIQQGVLTRQAIGDLMAGLATTAHACPPGHKHTSSKSAKAGDFKSSRA